MKARILKLSFILLILIGCSEKPAIAPVLELGPNVVYMKPSTYSPDIIRIKKGDEVFWKNTSTQAHNVVFEFVRSPYLYNTDQWSYKFLEVGSFSYYCEPHRGMGMVGTVIVE
jgi:plastocyanin